MGTHEHDSSVVKFDNPKDALIAARKLIERKDDWFGATDNPIASNLCAAQALARVTDNSSVLQMARLALDDAVAGSIFSFNDSHTHAEVLAAFDRAIAGAA